MPVIKSARKLKLKLTMKNARKLATAAEHGEYDEGAVDFDSNQLSILANS